MGCTLISHLYVKMNVFIYLYIFTTRPYHFSQGRISYFKQMSYIGIKNGMHNFFDIFPHFEHGGAKNAYVM